MHPKKLHSIVQFLALLAALWLGRSINDTAKAQPVRLSVSQEQPEVVFKWQTQRCDDNMIPDSPARATRLIDGRVMLIAAHYTNRIMLGESLSTVTPDCAVSSRGAESPDPAQFNDRFWVQSLFHTDGRLLGFASHEYHGKRHPGSCSINIGARVQCWYSSIIATEFVEKTFKFVPEPLEHRVIAASPSKFERSGPERSGFFTISNTVKFHERNYFFAYQEGMDFVAGNCLFRQVHAGDPFKWETLAPGGSWIQFPDPYQAGGQPLSAKCAPIGAGVISRQLLSLFLIDGTDRWIAVFNSQAGDVSGIYYAVTTDLIHWSPPQLLLSSSEARDNPQKCGTFYSYPSLLDQSSRAPTFDVGGADLWLYATRFNLSDCHSFMDRDLVRFKVKLDL